MAARSSRFFILVGRKEITVIFPYSSRYLNPVFSYERWYTVLGVRILIPMKAILSLCSGMIIFI